ncbi:MAG TPA: F0F1 ATP synthase subunit B [Solirubrobacteraceae bacterium]|jgi:F-type H+-transporting ATPase subunit b
MLAAPSLPLASGSFLISPNVGIMIWTIVVFLISLFILRKAVFPIIGESLDKRAKTIEGEIDAASDLRKEADKVLAEYRERLTEARKQAEEIVQRARQTAEAQVREAHAEGEAKREQLLEQTKRDIEAEARRSIDQIRREVADLTVLATEKVTRKTLTEEDQRRLVADALSELDFAVLSGDGAS